METDINLPFISHDPSSGTQNLELKLTRAKIEELINPIVERCKPSITKALEDAKLSTTDISKIILIGGPTRIPLVKKLPRYPATTWQIKNLRDLNAPSSPRQSVTS